MEWLAFLVGLCVGMLMRTDTSTAMRIADVKAFAVKPLAKLKGTPARRAPKYNDDRKAVAREREELGAN